ncbi:MAG: hypothetical protein ABL997_19935 [Planctomycetota bacterium]
MRATGRRSLVLSVSLVAIILCGALWVLMQDNSRATWVASEESVVVVPRSSPAETGESGSTHRSVPAESGTLVEFLVRSAAETRVSDVEVFGIKDGVSNRRQVPVEEMTLLGVTGPDGTARVSIEAPAPGQAAHVAKAPWADCVVPFRQVQPARWVADLQSIAEVRFQIVDTEGAPIEGADFAASKSPIPSSWKRTDFSIAVDAGSRSAGIATVASDAEGKALLRLVPGSYGIEVEHEFFVGGGDVSQQTFSVPGGPYRIVLAPLVGLALNIPDDGVYAISLRCKGIGSSHFRGLRCARERMEKLCPHGKNSLFYLATTLGPLLKATVSAFVEGHGWIDREYVLTRLDGEDWCQSLELPQGTDGSMACGTLRLHVRDASGRDLVGVPFTARGINGNRAWDLVQLQSGTETRVPPGTYDLLWGEGERIKKVVVDSAGRSDVQANIPHDARLCDIELAGKLLPDVAGGLFLEAFVGERRVARRGLDGAASGIRMLLPCGGVEFRASSLYLGTFSQFVDVPNDGDGSTAHRVVLGG